MFVFFHSFPVLWKSTFPMFWVLGIYGFLLLAKNVRRTWPWNVLFSQAFLVLAEIIPPCFGDNTTDVKTNEICYFWYHFHTNIYKKLFIEEANLICFWARPNICILDPFNIEVWKYIQYRIVGSGLYGSDSIAIFLWIWKLEFV